MRRLWWAAAGLFVMAGCTEPDAKTTAASASAIAPSAAQSANGGSMKSAESANAKLNAFATQFLGEYLEKNPTRATEAGEHRYDGRWPDMSENGEAEERRFVEQRLRDLAAIPAAELGPQESVDHALIENQLKYWLFAIDELKEAENDPVLYTRLVGDGLDPLVTREFDTIEHRMESLRSRLAGVPAIVQAAKQRLKLPPKIFTETAIQQNKGLVALCKTELAEHFAKVPAQKAALEAAAKDAAAALEDFQTFLEKELLARSDGDFRLGRARFVKKLRFELDDAVEIDAIAQGARDLLAKTQDEMAETAKELWPELMKGKPLPASASAAERKALVRQVLDKLAEDHPTNATIQKEANAWLEQATKFVREHDLVTVPPDPCRVIEMPEYRRGVAVAYCDASGPLEKKQETFYAIAPTPKDWPAKRAESFYREYNRSMLADLTIHEAMPGHFLQLMHNNKFPSKVRAVFSSGPFVEGWAVYTEWLMAKHGFGGPKVRMQRQKMVLRLSANAILDHGIHAGTMDEKAALDLMMNEAFQEEGEAVGKWKRARLSSAQLTTYYYGFTEMMKLREKHEKAPGFTERAYHDKLIGFGSPSMRAVRGLMSR
ncbi:Hypothetical protein A7982_06538 [Minicystis rosea]|nr:Hypothetical protein A7982_06538 [Minicystis rosea]